MEAWLTRRWYGESAPLALRPLSWIYGGAMTLRQAAYRSGVFPSHDPGRPVLVVGNLTVGGTGKTPLVIWVARQLAQRGLRAGIVSRGHGRSETAPRVVEEGTDWQLVGDEPVLLRRNSGCPTVVAADRVAGARLLVEMGVDVIVADDGLQHLRLRRKCEIVVVDATRGFGNGSLLPAGPLREPISRLRTVDAVVMNGGDAVSSGDGTTAVQASPAFTMSLEPQEIQPVCGGVLPRADSMKSPGPVGPGAVGGSASPDFAGQAVHAVAGIGNPARFFAALRERGIQVIEHPFPDHHAFAAADLAFGDGLPVLMTEKDAVKCRDFADPRLWYVPVAARFGEREGGELLERLLRKLDPTGHPRG